MKGCRIISIFIFAATAVCACASDCIEKVFDTQIKSESMNKTIPALVVLPDSYFTEGSRKYPVLYMLHGYTGSRKSWPKIKPDLQSLASKYDIVVVCPEVGNTWYIDSPIDKNSQYETYITKELVPQIEKKFRVERDKSKRGITGASMGGHGALILAIRNPEIFGAAGSTSGAVNLLKHKNTLLLDKIFGDEASTQELRKNNSAFHLVEKMNPGSPYLFIDCGFDDFLFDVNKALAEKLMKLKIPHDFTFRPGGHTHDYWNNAIEYHMLFFKRFFDGKINKQNK